MSHPAQPSDPPSTQIDLPAGPASLQIEGDGPPILLLHGYPGSGRDWRWLAPVLRTRAKLFRVDMPGNGGTPIETGPGCSALNRGAFALQLMEALGLQAAVLIGHSLGGSTAVALAAMAPERVRGIGLLSSVGRAPHWPVDQRWLKFGSALLSTPGLGSLALPLARRMFLAQGFSRHDTDAARAHSLASAAALDFNVQKAHFASLRCPVLTAWAEDDPLMKRAVLEDVDAASPAGPRLRFPDGGHNVQKTHANEIGAAILEWMEGLPGG